MATTEAAVRTRKLMVRSLPPCWVPRWQIDVTVISGQTPKRNMCQPRDVLPEGKQAMFPDLYLMRHGQTEWNLAGRLQGLRDSPLTARGIAQARRQARLIADIGAARYSSPQGRAVR